MQGSSTSLLQVAALPIAQVLPVVFFFVFLVWVVFTLVAAYHWFRYSNATTMALCAMTTHLIVSAMIAIYAVSGFA